MFFSYMFFQELFCHPQKTNHTMVIYHNNDKPYTQPYKGYTESAALIFAAKNLECLKNGI